MSTSSQNPKQYRFTERGHGSITADVVATERAPFAPRTERSYWQAIADSLNAAQSAGMPVGIDLDGTLTDHNAWSVVWDRDNKQWVLVGYDESEAAR